MSDDIKTEIKNGKLIITLPFNKAGTESASGKSMVHASTRGNKQVAVDNQVLNIGVNCYSKK